MSVVMGLIFCFVALRIARGLAKIMISAPAREAYSVNGLRYAELWCEMSAPARQRSATILGPVRRYSARRGSPTRSARSWSTPPSSRPRATGLAGGDPGPPTNACRAAPGRYGAMRLGMTRRLRNGPDSQRQGCLRDQPIGSSPRTLRQHRGHADGQHADSGTHAGGDLAVRGVAVDGDGLG